MSRIQTYSPMHPPEKVVSTEDMLRILAKHVPEGSLKPLPVGQTPKAELRVLQWLEPVKTGRLSGYVQTACGGYSISKDVSGDAVSYTAWKRVPDTVRNGRPYKEMPIHLGVFKARADAEAICQLEAAK